MGRTDELSVVIQSRIWIPDHFSTYLSMAEEGILRGLLAFLIQSPSAVHKS